MTASKSKEEIWKERIEKTTQHPGGILGYSQEIGVSASGFYQWRKKLLGRRLAVRASKAFLPVVATEVSREGPRSIEKPDAEWVGQMLASFVRGLE